MVVLILNFEAIWCMFLSLSEEFSHFIFFFIFGRKQRTILYWISVDSPGSMGSSPPWGHL